MNGSSFQLENFKLGLHEFIELLQALPGVEGFKNGLLVIQLQIQVSHDGVSELRWVLDGAHGHLHLRRDALVELDVGFKCLMDLPDECFPLFRFSPLSSTSSQLTRKNSLVSK